MLLQGEMTEKNIETHGSEREAQFYLKEMEVLPYEMPLGREAIELNAEERMVVIQPETRSEHQT
jgi:hypothetical protein